MTTEERIAELDAYVSRVINDNRCTNDAAVIAYELRALRLMLKDELREVQWRLGEPAKWVAREHVSEIETELARKQARTGSLAFEAEPYDQDNPIASRKAPGA